MPYLLRDIDHENGICLDFLQEAVSRFSEDETLVDVFVKAMVDISTQLSKLTMNDDYKSYVNVRSIWPSHLGGPSHINSNIGFRPSNCSRSSLYYLMH